MGRFYGKIGFSSTTETSPGVWTEQITERPYYGDILRHYYRVEEHQKVNSDIVLGNDISIVADAFAFTNIGYMKYVTLNDISWSISSAEVEYPRIKLVLGGMYNG